MNSAPPVYTVAEIAATAPDLALDDNGVPRTACYGVALTASAGDAEVAAAAETIRDSLPIAVGLLGDGDEVAPDLLDALDLTFAPLSAAMTAAPEVVAAPDPAEALTVLAEAIAARPQASVVLSRLLRATAELDVSAGLAAEAAAYSTLLAGNEYGGWLAARGGPRQVERSPDPVVVERQGDELTITLNRSERRNALDATMREALVEALAVAHAAPEVSVALRGTGPDFSSGGDLDEFGSALDPVSAYLVRLARHPGWLIDTARDRVTAYVHGGCIGAGIEIPAFAGRVVAAPDTYVVLPEVSMGLVPGAGGTVSIARRIGRWRTAWLALTGVRLEADRALGWGLVDEVCSR